MVSELHIQTYQLFKVMIINLTVIDSSNLNVIPSSQLTIDSRIAADLDFVSTSHEHFQVMFSTLYRLTLKLLSIDLSK